MSTLMTYILRCIAGVSALLSAWYIVVCSYIVSRRVGYPFELEWLEGDEFHHATRIWAGLSWYPRPSLEFFPNVYPPGFPLIAGLAMRLFGESLSSMRSVSIVSTLVIGGAIFSLVRRSSGWMYGLIACGLFFGCFEVCGSWFDVARVDMLGLALVMVSVATLELCYRPWAPVLATGIAALAVFVKQTNVAFLLVELLVIWTRYPQQKRRCLVLSGGIVVAGFALLQGFSDGWFSYYTIEIPRAAPRMVSKVQAFLVEDVMRVCGWSLAVIGTGAYALFRRRESMPLALVLLPVAAVVSLAARCNPGGYLNDLLPLACFAAPAACLALRAVTVAPLPRWMAPLAHLLLFGQLLSLRYDYKPLVPTQEDIDSGMGVVESIQKLPEPTLIPYHPYLLHLAGRPMHAHFHIINEVIAGLRGTPSLDRAQVLQHIQHDIQKHRWAAYVSSALYQGNEMNTWIDWQVRQQYVPASRLPYRIESHSLVPLTGNPLRPSTVYLPRSTP